MKWKLLYLHELKHYTSYTIQSNHPVMKHMYYLKHLSEIRDPMYQI